MTKDFDDLVINALARDPHRLFLALNDMMYQEIAEIMEAQGRAILTELFEKQIGREESTLRAEQIKRVTLKIADEIVLAGMKKLTDGKER